MKRATNSVKQTEAKKMRQCVIGRTKNNELEVSGADGWLGKGAVITKVSMDRPYKFCPTEKVKKKQKAISSYFQVLKPAAEEVEELKLNSVDEVQKPEDDKVEPMPIICENLKNDKPSEIDPSYEDFDFSLNDGVNQNTCVNYQPLHNEHSNEILSLEDFD